MDLLGTIVEVFDLSQITSQLEKAVRLFFTRMFEYKQKTKSKVIPKSFISAVMIFFARLVMKHDVNTLWQLTDVIQQDILNNLLEKEGDKIGCVEKGDPYKKVCIVGITQLMNNENQRLSSDAFCSLTKGMCELIIG